MRRIAITLYLLTTTFCRADIVGIQISIFAEKDGIPSYDAISEIKELNVQRVDTDKICFLLKSAKNPYGRDISLSIQSQRHLNDKYTKALFEAINANSDLILSYYNSLQPFRNGFPTRKE